MARRTATFVLIGAALAATGALAGSLDVVAPPPRPLEFLDTPRERLAMAGIATTGRAALLALARIEAERTGLPWEMIVSVMRVESAFDPTARGADGEVGLMQVMPPTARQLGFDGTLGELAKPDTNIRLGATYLAEAWRLAGGDICTAAMKYRAGWGETRFSVRSVAYCRRVREHLAALGYPVTGIVPNATFGFEADVTAQNVAITSRVALRNRLAGRKVKRRVDWRAYEQRMRSLDRAGRISIGP